MKPHLDWSYRPYRQPLTDGGEIYICRVVPDAHSISFEWLDIGAEEYEIQYRVRSEGCFVPGGKTKQCHYILKNLEKYCEYEFCVKAGEKSSHVRIARCDDCVGTAVNYLHPEDETYSYSGRYLFSPSLVRHPDGYLLASMDLGGMSTPGNLTLIYRSDDDGKTWSYVSDIFPCMWGKLFLYQDELYLLSCSTEYGDLLIGKSEDGGMTFSDPRVLLRGSGGKNGTVGVHKNPQPVVEFEGRLWSTLEWGNWAAGYHAAMVMSAPVGSDLMDPESWSFSEPVKYDPYRDEGRFRPSTGNIEGALAVIGGKLYNIMRYDMTKLTPNFGQVSVYRVNTEDPEAPLEYVGPMQFPANHSKFMIKQDETTGKYYSIVCRILSSKAPEARNLLSLMVSPDGWHWEVAKNIYDWRDYDSRRIGFQYVDFLIEGEEIRFLCRTAMNRAHSFHDSNYITFDKIPLK